MIDMHLAGIYTLKSSQDLIFIAFTALIDHDALHKVQDFSKIERVRAYVFSSDENL